MTGAAWSSSARALRCSVKSVNERNPCPVLLISQETAGSKPEDGMDDVKSSWPLCLGLHTCYNGAYRTTQDRKVEQIAKRHPSSDWRLQLASMKPESLVNADQQWRVECVPGSCTHRPSHYERWGRPKYP